VGIFTFGAGRADGRFGLGLSELLKAQVQSRGLVCVGILV
jgi:hypothetical protein